MALELIMAKGVERARALRKIMTPPELALWFQLRALRGEGWRFRRQSPEGRYILDFVCRRAKLVIEVDGSQHGDEAQGERDRVRDTYLTEHGFVVMRFWAAEIAEALDDVMRRVREALGAGGGRLADGVAPDHHEGPRISPTGAIGVAPER